MTLSEEEAKKKWCPFGHMYGPNGAYNRSSYDEAITKCLGSKCMVWKWVDQDEQGKFITGRCGY